MCVCVGGGGGGGRAAFKGVSINPLVVKVRNVLDLVHKERERVGLLPCVSRSNSFPL